MKKLFLFLLLLPWMACAGMDEVSIATPNEECRLNYLTATIKDRWTFQLEEGTCSEGFVQGFARVNLFNAQGKLSEKIQGFFVKGYWLGGFAAQGPFVARTTPEPKQQALIFILSKEKHISYVVQLRAQQSEQGSYGPFMGCPDFRLMAVVDDPALFQKVSFQEKIAEKTLSLAHLYCQNLEQVALFGAKKLNAQASDILFQMNIDPDTEEREIVFQNLKPEEEALVVPQKKDEKPFLPLKNEFLKIMPLAHLDILSRLSNQPQNGRIVVHVNQLNLDGSAWVDLPEKIKLKNNSQLKTGWLVVQGLYHQKQMSVSSVKSCVKEWCLDVQ